MDDRSSPAFLSRLRDGRTEEAWAEFLQSFTPYLYRVIDRFTRDEESRSDCFVFVCDHLAAQDCRRLRKFEPNDSALFTTWLYSVVFNLCLDWRRTQRPRLRLVSLEDLSSEETACASAEGSDDPADLAARQIDESRLAHVLDRLPADARVMVRRRDVKEMTLAEVARLMGMANAQAADRRLHAIIARLREELAVPKAENAPRHPFQESGARDLQSDKGGH